MNDEQIEKCRVSLWITMVTAFATEDIERLIQFERLDAVAQNSRYISQAAYVRAAAELAEFVTAVLAGDA